MSESIDEKDDEKDDEKEGEQFGDSQTSDSTEGGKILVTAVIPAWHRTDKLELAVRSLLKQSLDRTQYEIIVVDSSSNEDNLAMVNRIREEAGITDPRFLKCLRKKAEGPGPSRNMGAENARADLIGFMDSDCQATPDWLAEGIKPFEDASVGIVQGRTIPEPDVPTSALTTYVWVEQESFIYETANIFYRKTAFEQAGGFTADMHPKLDKPMGGEDVDLAWRVKRNDWQSTFAEKAEVWHEVVKLTLFRWLYDKRLFMFPRFLASFPEIRRYFFLRYFYDLSHFLLFLLLMGLGLAFVSPFLLGLCLPYLLHKLLEPTDSFRGIKRPIRVAAHLMRDLTTFGVLLAASFKYRALLI